MNLGFRVWGLLVKADHTLIITGFLGNLAKDRASLLCSHVLMCG